MTLHKHSFLEKASNLAQHALELTNYSPPQPHAEIPHTSHSVAALARLQATWQQRLDNSTHNCHTQLNDLAAFCHHVDGIDDEHSSAFRAGGGLR